MIKLLEEIDEMLAAMECVAHGMEGRAITEMRGRIQTELSNSHKHGVMQGLPHENIADLYNELSGSPTVGKAGEDASVSDGK